MHLDVHSSITKEMQIFGEQGVKGIWEWFVKNLCSKVEYILQLRNNP
ncbi:15455_t:CDS:2 [Racocetra fulgida]|uniref:15455_t:CDS:1 n=1 Tax=Racocetra fulgida TaxID=60492 RepID=A0A9N9F3E4_9GLOM|nr:15455_t:CDS:2 [Racocetra fulgida]